MEPHPSENESITDKAFRYFNEMDFTGQSKAKWICIIVQVISAVSDYRIQFVQL